MRWGTAIAVGVIGAIFLALAAQASANWLHKGKGELKENASVTMSGEVTLTTSAGNISCPTTIGATLTKESTAGDVNSYTVSEPSKCDVTGSLGSICGTHGLTKVEKTGTWGLTATESDIAVSSIDLHFTFAGCLISGFRLKGSATMSVNKASAISSVSLSGSQDLYNSLEEKAGTGSLGGTLSVAPAATYGIQPVPDVETKWRMDNELLSENEELNLSGNFSFSYSGGAVSCPVTATLSLTAGTVEEESPEGEVKSFAVSEPAKCDVTGALKTLCGTNSVSSVEKTGTWSLNTNEEDISVSGLSLDYKFSKCAVTSLRVEGVATLAVDDVFEISEATWSGGPSVYNASEEKLGTAELSGTHAASPTGTFGIKERDIEAEETHQEETETHEEMTAEDKGSPESPGEHIFLDKGESLGTKRPTTGMTGTLTFNFATYSIECAAEPMLSIATNSADLVALGLDTNECTGTGPLSHCDISSHTLTSGSSIFPAEWDIELYNFKLALLFATAPGEGGSTCTVAGVPLELRATELTLNVDNPSAISSISLSGSATWYLGETPIYTNTIYGEFEVAEKQLETISVE